MPKVRGVGVILALLSNFFKRQGSCIVEVPVYGNDMLLDSGDYIGNILIFTPQWYDHNERKILKTIICKGDYVVDVGANVGVYTLLFACLVGESGTVDSIEAEPGNFGVLVHNISINSFGWVRPLNVGVSDKIETLKLSLNTKGNAGAHSFSEKTYHADSVFSNVDCKPLYGLIRLKKPKLMKLDIEGFEWRVLRNLFEKSPKEFWPEYLLMEDEPTLREGDAVALAQQVGYRVMRRFSSNVFLVLDEG